MLTFGNTFLNYNGTYLTGAVLNYNPLNLRDNTIRVKFNSGVPTRYSNRTLIDSKNNVWDIRKLSNDWEGLFRGDVTVCEVYGANTTNVSSMRYLFHNCSALSSVSLFDTSNVTNMDSMFSNCSSLTSVPLLNTYNVSSMNYMFSGCTDVENGALAFYKQASTQATPPVNHYQTFYNCGINTQTGSAELSQIPSNWK